MNLMDLFIKIGVDDQATSKISKITSSVGNGLKTAAKVGTAALGVAAAGITALTTASIKQYADYEQLVGGVETLFKNSAGKIQDYAARAYQTAGLSANQYMSTVTSFSASLLQSLGGDTEKAAEYADMAIRDMSDNANKMGTDMELIQNAYQGFAKQNYTMLDNLKLGYGGTKEEMARLIADAAELSDTVDAQSMSFANIVEAINVVQREMGIYGTTAKEASSTITGSIAAVKSQWQNLLTAISQGDDWDILVFIENFVDTVEVAFGNLVPIIEKSLVGAVKLIEGLFPRIIQTLPSLFGTLLPSIVNGAVNILQTFVTTLAENGDLLVESAINAVMTLAEGILNMLPTIIETGLQLLVSLAYGIAENLPTLIPTIIDVIMQIVNILTAPEQLQMILNAALTLITKLAMGLIDALPSLVDACVTIIENIVLFLTDPENIGKLLLAAVQIVLGLATGIIKSIPRLLELFIELPKKIIKALFETDWGQIGKDIINGIWNGLKQMWTSLTSWFSDAWDSLVGSVKDFLGIHSPSRVFADIGKNMALGVGVGWNKNFARIKGDINKSLDFDDVSLGVSTYRQSDVFGESIRGGVSVIQNIYSEAKTAADLMEEATYRLQIAEMGAS
jgi:phage-related protein